jgi:hypothetical protein
VPPRSISSAALSTSFRRVCKNNYRARFTTLTDELVGTDRFNVNIVKGLWLCRRGCGGGDVIDLMTALHGYGFVDACTRLMGEAPPGINGTGGTSRCTQPTAAELEKLAEKLAQDRAEAAELDRQERERQRQKARWLWRQSELITGTIGETYFRDARGYRGVLPATLRFLPARDGHPPAVIAAFGLTREIAPGVLAPIATDAVLGVHLIKLLPDGSDRIRDKALKPKITIGIGVASPIVLAEPRGWTSLIIAESIEDALTAYDLTGHAAWAAAGAGRMPGLASWVPAFVDRAIILVDDNKAGRCNSDKLADRLRKRGVDDVRMVGGQP